MKGSLSGDYEFPIYAGGILLWRAKLTLARIEKQGREAACRRLYIIFLGSRDYFHGLFALYLPDDKKKYQQGHLIR